jgi:hypothetical protein
MLVWTNFSLVTLKHIQQATVGIQTNMQTLPSPHSTLKTTKKELRM